MNRGFIRGTVDSIEANAKYTRYLILTDGAGAKVKKAGIGVMAFRQMFDVAPGDLVDVDCHVEITHVVENGEGFVTQIVKADDIRKTKRDLVYMMPELENVIKQKGGNPIDKDEFLIAGYVNKVDMARDRQSAMLMIRTNREDVPNSIATARIVCQGRQKDFAEHLSKGDPIIVSAYVRNGNNPARFKNEMLVCRDLARIPEKFLQEEKNPVVKNIAEESPEGNADKEPDIASEIPEDFFRPEDDAEKETDTEPKYITNDFLSNLLAQMDEPRSDD